jgi:hypothetical protein
VRTLLDNEVPLPRRTHFSFFIPLSVPLIHRPPRGLTVRGTHVLSHSSSPPLILCLLLGCNRGPTKTDLPPEEKHILKLAALYSDFRGKNGRQPKTIDELKAFAKKVSREDLQQRGLDDVEQAFISPRDNQPDKLVPPQPPKRGGPPMPLVILYEKTGVDGKHMVASGRGGGAFEWDEQTLRQNIPNP